MVSNVYRSASRMSPVSSRNILGEEIVLMPDLTFTARMLLLFVTATLAIPAAAEVVQLTPIEEKIEADVLRERSVWELKEIESAKRFIITFVSKWDVERKYRSTSPTYKKWRKTDALKSAFNKESYDRIEFSSNGPDN